MPFEALLSSFDSDQISLVEAEEQGEEKEEKEAEVDEHFLQVDWAMSGLMNHFLSHRGNHVPTPKMVYSVVPFPPPEWS